MFKYTSMKKVMCNSSFNHCSLTFNVEAYSDHANKVKILLHLPDTSRWQSSLAQQVTAYILLVGDYSSVHTCKRYALCLHCYIKARLTQPRLFGTCDVLSFAHNSLSQLTEDCRIRDHSRAWHRLRIVLGLKQSADFREKTFKIRARITTFRKLP